ncbi:MAG: hypothetical protein A2073_05265 [Deltaproteobacteria bacterium GWC2_42_11]|nr:MAG: hypothetical protein A2073_05265 [Deltaproteobacteria bacterium GWC2_42_11]
MKLTPLDIRQHNFKKRVRGYDPDDVDTFLELAAEALEEAAKKVHIFEEKLNRMSHRLEEHEGREKVLKETLTTAQKMVEDIKNNARKEAELIVSEANIRADEIISNAQQRVVELREEIQQLKRQRLEFQSGIKSLLEYHSKLIQMEEEDAAKKDVDDEKVRFLQKQ